MSYFKDFGPFEDNIWLNCAHQGALPRVAVEEALEAINWKIAPYNLTSDRFSEVPQQVREALGRLIKVPPKDIILSNSNSYGLHLLANGIQWQPGDEILLMKGDFPSDILPWLALEKQGVRIRYIQPNSHVIQADELLKAISPSTKLFCTTWVHSFSGYTIDLNALGEICHNNGVIFVVNGSQALGARPLQIQDTHIDAITSAGFKWLCGPYGTGFCWIKPELRENLEYNKNYWLSMQTADDLGKPSTEIRVRSDLGARKYDIFGTANFFNFKPWAASIEYLLGNDIEQIQNYDQKLVSRFINGLDRDKYTLLSPESGMKRSTLIFISHNQPSKNKTIYGALRKHGIHIAFRVGSLRVSPHLYNTEECIDRVLVKLNEM